METPAVDLGRGDHPHGHARGNREHGMVEPFPVSRLDLLGVVQRRERPHAMTAQGVVVEEHPATTRGPASDPRPASSAPATNRTPRRRS